MIENVNFLIAHHAIFNVRNFEKSQMSESLMFLQGDRASSVASAASKASDLSNESGTHLECQVKRHHRLALVTLPLPLDA